MCKGVVMDISEKTKLPLFAVLVSLPFMIGAIMWFTTVAGDASRASADVKSVRELVLDLRDRMVRIEILLSKEKH
jgi:hypothetical protein